MATDADQQFRKGLRLQPAIWAFGCASSCADVYCNLHHMAMLDCDCPSEAAWQAYGINPYLAPVAVGRVLLVLAGQALVKSAVTGQVQARIPFPATLIRRGASDG